MKSNVIWNNYPDVLPSYDDTDEDVGSNFLLKIKTFNGYKYIVERFDFEDMQFYTNLRNNVTGGGNTYLGKDAVYDKIVAWAFFNGK